MYTNININNVKTLINNMTEFEHSDYVEQIIQRVRDNCRQYPYEDLSFDENYNGVLCIDRELLNFQYIYTFYKDDEFTYFVDCSDVEEVADMIWQKSNEWIVFCLWYLNLGGSHNSDVKYWVKANRNIIY